MGALTQMQLVIGAQHHATAGGQHAVGLAGEFVDDLFFHIAEAALALAFKKFADRTAQPGFNDMVRVDKRQMQPPGQLPAHGGFA